jgi:hypothetical protein
LHHFEGQSISESSGEQQAIAQIVARRPTEATSVRNNLV